MGAFSGPKIVEDGLVLALDGANYKSFKGEVTTNLIPNPTINAYPTTGNGWGTYNTNQYNGAQYFSIGSISSVSSNIITTSSNHPLRTYDVVRPQTTGGGVTAGTNYFVKKLSDTTFTLHAYNSSQDGSQGYINPTTGTHKVYDSIATDARISVNSTSFPTMWWGPPHLPNSGLVKELRYGEFDAIPNLPANDCIRLHYIRTDNVKDGMSYGVNCSVTPSSPVTVSFYTRSANTNAVGKVVQYYIYNYTGGSASAYAWNFTLGPVGVWQRQTFTYTPAYGTMISYWFPQSSGVYSWDWSCMQVEQKSYATNFVAGTRGSTVATGGGWKDLIGSNNGELVNGVREDSANGGSLVFDGSNDYVTTTLGTYTPYCIDIWFKNDDDITSAQMQGNYQQLLGVGTYPGGISLGSWTSSATDETFSFFSAGWSANGMTYIRDTASSGIHNLVVNWNGSSFDFWLDGTKRTAYASSYGHRILETVTGFQVGSGYNNANSYEFDGSVYSVKVYTSQLSDAQVQQNFNATRKRFGL